MHCGYCGSPDTEAEFDLFFCFQCGRKTDFHGNVMPPQPEFKALNHQEKRELGEVQ